MRDFPSKNMSISV